jgi:hypothetical protein
MAVPFDDDGGRRWSPARDDWATEACDGRAMAGQGQLASDDAAGDGRWTDDETVDRARQGEIA